MIIAQEQEWPAWTEEWPVEPGWYWFYGVPLSGWPAELSPVNVKRGGGSSVYYVLHGTFMYKRSASGVWTPMIVPVTPDTQKEEES